MLSAMDDTIGRVLDALRKHSLEEQTLVVFISDNGGPTPQTTSSNLPLRGHKGQPFEGGIREAFIIQWKGHLPAGSVDDRPVSQLDEFPTAMALDGCSSSSRSGHPSQAAPSQPITCAITRPDAAAAWDGVSARRADWRQAPWQGVRASLMGEARGLQGQYLPAIQETARTVKVTQILQDVRQ